MENGLKSNDKEIRIRTKEYRRKLFGFLDVRGAPPEYYELQVMFELAISPREWSKMSLEEKGKYIAYYQLKNMATMLEYHEMYQDQEYKEEFAKKQQ